MLRAKIGRSQYPNRLHSAVEVARNLHLETPNTIGNFTIDQAVKIISSFKNSATLSYIGQKAKKMTIFDATYILISIRKGLGN